MALAPHWWRMTAWCFTGLTGGRCCQRPPGLPPLIEARGIGLLHAPLCAQARVVLVVDMGQTETDRLPPQRRTLLGLQLRWPLFTRSRPGIFQLRSCTICLSDARNDDAPPPPTRNQRLILVTGPSGAGRSTAISALEDLGCEAIDNLPLSLMPRLLDGPPLGRPSRWGSMCATAISALGA
jgi:hypothetical protein